MTEPRSEERPTRDWQFCFRAAELLMPCVTAHPGLRSRRADCLQREPPFPSALESARFSAEVAAQAEWLAERWCSLCDQRRSHPSTHVFVDGYAALFFVSVLYSNVTVLLRGQCDDNWKVQTSSTRWRETKGESAFANARDAATRFVRRVEDWPDLRAQYPNGLREEHREAVCQHYGFPTEYLDVTFACDVALFFAEDLPHGQPRPERGVIYAVPFHAVARSSSLVTLPPAVMRPMLQHAKFLRGTARVLDTLEQHRLVFRHTAHPVSQGLSQTGFDTPPRLRQYLYPPSDPIEAIAKEFRQW